MMELITFQQERWDQYFKDCQALWQEHYDELAVDKSKMPMGPDVFSYMGFEARGQLQILTARMKGQMVGYFLSIIRVHPHYKVLCGFEDSYFLTKAARRGLTGVRLIKENERLLRLRGVQKVFVHSKLLKDLSSIFSYLGYAQSDIVYSKWIGD